MIRATLVFISLMVQLWAGVPSWFGTLHNNSKTDIIGYGEGLTLNEAKSNAKSDVAKTIRSYIYSSFTTQTSVNNATVKHDVQASVTETSNLSISDTQIVRSEESNGYFYVALKYDNLPVSIKLAKRGGQSLCGISHPYLAQTPILINLSSELNCSVSVELTREQNGWYLGHGQYSVILSDSDLQKLMIETSKGLLSIHSTHSQVNVDEAYSLTLDGLPSMGYLSLFDVYDDGRVVLMDGNVDLTKHIKEDLRYPEDIRQEFQLVGGVLEAGKDALDLYVVIISSEPLKLSSFIAMGQKVENGERAFAFDRLLALMQNNTFATTVVTTRFVKK